MSSHRLLQAHAMFALVCLLPLIAVGQTLNVSNDVQKIATLNNTTATLAGKAEFHVTGTGDPIPGCTINLTSDDAWFFMDNILPSQVASTFLSRIQVNGAAAVQNSNVRIAQYGSGAVVIPQSPKYGALQVFDGQSFTGASKALQTYTAYNNTSLGTMKGAIRSFRLKRGYTATVAQQESGNGVSVNYVAQDGDLEVGVLPDTLDKNIAIIRVFPWRWVNKKGIAGDIAQNLNVRWYYDWNISQNSSSDLEYVPIRQQRYWPSLTQDWKARGASQILGYNEPDQSNQANLAVGDAVYSWPDLLGTGLRVGAPAVSDGGTSWLYSFIDQCNAANLRVDFVPIHYYRSYSSASDPDGATTQFYNFLKGIHDRVKRPLWVTEFNNGANWTTGPDPTAAQQQATVAKMIAMLDSTPFVERYALYNWVEDVRRVVWDDGSLTAAGVTYHDDASTPSYTQAMPVGVAAPNAQYAFNGDVRDSSGNGHDGMLVGAPSFAAGKYGQALVLDGKSSYVQLPPQVSNTSDFTFAAWVNWSGGANWQRIFDFGDGTNKYLFLTPQSSANTLRFAITTGSGEQQLNAPALTAGQWTHVAVTISGNTGKLYVNGSPVGTSFGISVNPADVGATLNLVGKSRFATDPLFAGQLDDLRILPTALTDAQIATLASSAPFGFNANPVTATAVKLTPYTGSVAANVTGGSGALTFSKLSGPTWLTVGADGNLTGTPAASDLGSNLFLVSVTDASGAVSTGPLQVMVLSTLPAPAITSTATADGQRNVAFSYQIAASNSPTNYATSGLPSGLGVDTTTGLISGIPLAAGTFSVTLSATNAGGTGASTLTLTVADTPVVINPTVAPVITSAITAAARVGTAFSYQTTASNTPTGYTATGLPDGLSIDSTSGLISGMPTQAGAFNLNLNAINSGGTGTATLALSVAEALPVVSITSVVRTVTIGSGEIGELEVSLSQPQATDLTVLFAVTGSAVNGQDYVLLSGHKKIKGGKTSKPIKIVPLGDLGGTSKKIVKVILAPSTAYTVGASPSAKVKILPAQ